MYIYHALIDALSDYMIRINLNVLFCTHVEHSPTKTTHTKHHTERHTHTQTRMNSNVTLSLCTCHCQSSRLGREGGGGDLAYCATLGLKSAITGLLLVDNSDEDDLILDGEKQKQNLAVNLGL